MSLTCPGLVSCQHNRDKASAPLRQNQYHSKSHTSPDKRVASAKGNIPTDNQQDTQVSKHNKNGNNTIVGLFRFFNRCCCFMAAVNQNPVFFLEKKQLDSLTGNT